MGGDTGALYTPYILDPHTPTEMLVGTCRVWRGAPTVPPSAFNAISVDFDTLAPATCTGDEVNLVSGLAEGGPTADSLSTTVYATSEGTGPNAVPPSGGEVWVTTNAGITPMENMTGAINPTNYTISSVAMDASDPTGATAYVGIMGFNVPHIFQTTNAGSSWTNWSGSGSAALPDAPVNALLVDSSVAPPQIYAGTDVGVFVSSATSPSWAEVGTPALPGATGYLPNVPVTAIRIFNSGIKKLRVATYGRGIWEYALPNAPDYANVISNTPQTIYPPQTATFNGTLTAFGGYASEVNLSCAAAILPATCTLNPTQTMPTPSGATYTLTAGGVVGDYNFNAQAVGTDGGATTHDAPVTMHIVDFSISAPTPGTLSVPQGEMASANFQVAAEGSFSGTVNLSCSSGLPSGTSCQFSPSSAVTPSSSNPVTVTMTVSAAANAPVSGPTTVTLAANVTGAPAGKTQTFALSVTLPPPDFVLAISTIPPATVLGQDLTWNGTLTAISGYSKTVNLSCVGAPPATCVVNPTTLSPTATGAAFSVTVGSAATGTFSFGIQGTDGTLTHTQVIALAVGTDVTWTDTGNLSGTVAAGQSSSYAFSATPVGGATFTAAVNFSCANLPAVAICTFNPATISAGSGATAVALTITTAGPNQGAAVRRAVPSNQYPAPSKQHPAPSKGQVLPRNSKIGLKIGLVWLLTLPITGIVLAGMARRKTSRKRAVSACGLLALVYLALLIACGGLGSGGSGTTVSVSPLSAIVPLASQQQFSATVVNGSSQSVTWTVNGGDANGAIGSSSGLYQAPGIMPASPTVTVTATSQVNPSASGTATVTLTGPLVSVTVSPIAASLFADEPGNTWPTSAVQQQFSANVVNGSSQTVTWQVAGGSESGTIDSTGLYTAPASVPNPPSISVTATSPLTASSGMATVAIEAATPVGTFSNIQAIATATGGAPHADLVTLTVD
ncbi:MAG: hypothetical protein WBS24_13490 [Terriglobales bacterium]